MQEIINSFIRYPKGILNEYKWKHLIATITVIVIIFVTLDCFNIPSIIYEHIGLPALITISLLIIMFIMINTRIFDLIKLQSTNYVDFYTLASLLSTTIYFIILQISTENNTLRQNQTKSIILAIIIILSITMLTTRIIYLSKTSKNAKQNKSKCNIISLKQLYDNNIPQNTQNIFVDDEAVSYDLLNRGRIINQIIETFRNCNNDSKFIIALKGPWGSGKTTILNNVEEQFKKDSDNNIIFLRDFDPWVYDNKESLFVALFDKIMKNIKCGFRINEFNLFKQTFLRTLMLKSELISINPFKNEIHIERIKSIIEDYLERNNKRLVIVIDNLERCPSENLLFLLNIVHNVLSLNRVIYVLSYDEEAMKKQFFENLRIDYRYLEKLIQLEFTVPRENPAVVREVIRKCLSNYLKYNEIKLESKHLNQIIDILTSKIDNLRDLKRIINSTFSTSFTNSNHLNPIDTLSIEIIALENRTLWEDIYENGVFYISEDRNLHKSVYILDYQKYNEDTTKYFDNLFRNNLHNANQYKEILRYLFPNVEKYFKERRRRDEGKIEFIPENSSFITDDQKNSHTTSINQIRIYNSRFFNLYFYKNDNEYIDIHKGVDSFINFLNTTNDFRKISEKYVKMLFILPGWREKETLETFEINLNKINPQKYILLVPILFDMYYITDDTPQFFSLSARQITVIIISRILLRMTEDEFDMTLRNFSTSYKDLFLIKEIVYWTNPDIRIEKTNKERYDRINGVFENMKNEIITQKINMYNFKNYHRHNAPQVLTDKSYSKYLRNQINTTILPLFLCDCIGYATGSDGLSYIFDKKRIESMYGWSKARHDIAKSPRSKLKTFLEKALNNASTKRRSNDSYGYDTDHWTDLEALIEEYLTLIDK